MVLTNYKRGYIERFDCSIYGTIKMSVDEYRDVVHFLRNRNYDWKHVLESDLERRIETKKGFYANIRTTATGLIARKWKLKGYKNGNYQLFVQS